MNTPQKGSFRHIVFKEDGVWYAVALEFNIVESGDDPRLALFNMFEAVAGYIEAAKKIKESRHNVLNQPADLEYEKLWNSLQQGRPIKSPYRVHTYGVSRV